MNAAHGVEGGQGQRVDEDQEVWRGRVEVQSRELEAVAETG